MNALATRLAAGAATLAASAAPVPAADLVLPSLDDRIAIGDAIVGIGLHADRHEWDRLEASFAPEVTTDYTSLFGGTPQTQARSALVAGWRGMLPGFDATQHMVTVAEVRLRDPDHATARSYVRATHRLGTALWVVGGFYTHELVRSPEGWRVTFMRLGLLYEEGDRGLVAGAAERAQALR